MQNVLVSIEFAVFEAVYAILLGILYTRFLAPFMGRYAFPSSMITKVPFLRFVRYTFARIISVAVVMVFLLISSVLFLQLLVSSQFEDQAYIALNVSGGVTVFIIACIASFPGLSNFCRLTKITYRPV